MERGTRTEQKRSKQPTSLPETKGFRLPELVGVWARFFITLDVELGLEPPCCEDNEICFGLVPDGNGTCRLDGMQLELGLEPLWIESQVDDLDRNGPGESPPAKLDGRERGRCGRD